MENELNQLIQHCKEGDLASFEKVVQLFSARVSNVIYSMINNSGDVDDIAQEVFIKIYKNIATFREESKFSTWIHRITVNTVWDYLRKSKNRKTIPIENVEPPFVSDEHGKEDLGKLMRRYIEMLPVEYRTVLVLKDIEDCSYKEIAEITKCRMGTVESRLFRARQALKELLKETTWWRDYL